MLRFFGEQGIERAIDAVAGARKVTVVVGAGASMEIGLPSWADLVARLLDTVIEQRGWGQDRVELRRLAERNGLVSAAEVVVSLLPKADLKDLIHRELYRDDRPADLRPGPLAEAVARMQWTFGPSMRIATTNYDLLLEAALRASSGGSADVRTYVRSEESPAGTVSVTHLHGVLGAVRKGQIVLSERDYVRTQSGSAWQEKWMLEALNESSCLFLGTSLTDPNLLRYFHGHRQTRPHFATLIRRPARTPDEHRLRDRWEEAQASRWQAVGVTPLFADHFADAAQFVHEISLRRSAGSRAYRPFQRRFDEWFGAESTDGVLRLGPEVFRELQARLNDGLNSILEQTRAALVDQLPGLARETLSLALWALTTPPSGAAQESVVVWATADRVMTTPDSITPVELTSASPWTAVKAICSGTSLEESKDVYASRWRFVRAVPVYRHGDDRIPLGAVSLSTIAPMDRTALAKLRRGQRTELDRLLAESGRALLDTVG